MDAIHIMAYDLHGSWEKTADRAAIDSSTIVLKFVNFSMPKFNYDYVKMHQRFFQAIPSVINDL